MGILKKIGMDWKERRLLSNLYMKQRIKVRIGEEMSKGRLNEEHHGRCKHRRRRRFGDDMAFLAEDERMLMELNDRCEVYGMKININKAKTTVIGRKPKKINMQIKD